MATKFNVSVGQTVNILHDGIQRTAMTTNVSANQIDVRFWDDDLNTVHRKFTSNGVLRYIKNENSKILSLSL